MSLPTLKPTKVWLRYRESVKLGLIIGAFMSNLIILGIVSQTNNETSKNSERIREQVAAENAEREQAREENAARDLRSQKVASCFLKIFIDYTHTQRPIVIEDIDECDYIVLPSRDSAQGSSSRLAALPAESPREPSGTATTRPTTSRTEAQPTSAGGNSGGEKPGGEKPGKEKSKPKRGLLKTGIPGIDDALERLRLRNVL